MGLLAEKLHCQVTWKGKELQVLHPTRGPLKVSSLDGCPQVEKKLALQLIEELEDVARGRRPPEEMKEETEWMRKLVETHPVLRGLPSWIKQKLCVDPKPMSLLPANRRKRKILERDGVILHLYSGDENGLTLARAWKQIGGEEKHLLEVDLKRGSDHDMIPDEGVYAALLTTALQGRLRAV